MITFTSIPAWLKTLALLVMLFPLSTLQAQKKTDSTAQVFSKITIDSASAKKLKKAAPYDTSFSPKKATIRSAIIPGWGQVYNKQLWKVPLVYAALGITAGIFVVNVQEYSGLRSAYKLKVDTDTSNDKFIPDRYSVLSANSMKFYRDEYRKNVDLSVLAFVIAWALNVVDATVSGHLKQFDVSDDLSLKIKPNLSVGGQSGLSFVLNFKNKNKTAVFR